MDRAGFEAGLRSDGYEPTTREFAAGEFHAEHSHGFDARLLITAGEMTLTIGDEARLYRAGDVCEVPAGTPHSETIGAAGVSLLIGRRSKAG